MDYCLRLDDACPQMNAEKWKKMESILDEYKIKPIVGVIPENRDPDFVSVADENFWGKACEWQSSQLRAGDFDVMICEINFCLFSTN